MIGKIVEGASVGGGIAGVLAVAFAIAWAGDVFTIDKDGTLKFAVSDQGKITVGATESYVNLVIQNDEVVAESDNKVDITADVLTVEGIRLENMAVSANIETSGAGGLDTGTETIDPVNTTWHYIWVITNNDGSARNGLLSLSSTSPTMPSGYTKKRRVGAVGNTTVAGNFLQFVQEGNQCNYLDGRTNNRILTAGVAVSWTTVQAGNFIPPTSRRGLFKIYSQIANSAIGWYTVFVRQANFASTAAQTVVPLYASTATVTWESSAEAHVNTDQNQRIDYYIYTAPSANGAYIDVLGYYDRI